MISIEKNRTFLICMFAAVMILAVPAFAFAGNTAADTDNDNPNLVYRDIEKSWPKISNTWRRTADRRRTKPHTGKRRGVFVRADRVTAYAGAQGT